MAQATKAPTGVTIWHAMREELLLNMYPLPYTTLPPSIFYVYLHPADYERIEGIVPRLVAELQRSLTDEVKKINQGRERAGGVLSRLIAQEEAPPIEAPASGWEVHIHPDRNDTLKPGHLGIESMLPLPAPGEFGGPPTTRIVKSVVTEAGRSSTTIEIGQPPPPQHQTAEPDTRERAVIRYTDDQGAHVFSMRKDTLSIGRGGSSVWVDVQVISASKVSREHVRLRHDRSGAFFIRDVSSWGTSVNGQPLPAAVKGPDGVLLPGDERELPPVAQIQLADALVLHFEGKLPK
jgi:pSer/pThr/pTyr-binding forkhead associated (FHA) protein